MCPYQLGVSRWWHNALDGTHWHKPVKLLWPSQACQDDSCFSPCCASGRPAPINCFVVVYFKDDILDTYIKLKGTDMEGIFTPARTGWRCIIAGKYNWYSTTEVRQCLFHGPLVRYVKCRIGHAPGMPGMFSRHRRLTIPTCITARAWRTCRDAYRGR